MATTSIDATIIKRYSSWGKLVRVIAYCRRWKHHNKGPLTATELQQARNAIIKMVQHLSFQDELTSLSKTPNAPLKSKLKRLNPFLDKDGLLRVGGRLKHSVLPFSQWHGIILPKSDVTALIQ